MIYYKINIHAEPIIEHEAQKRTDELGIANSERWHDTYEKLCDQIGYDLRAYLDRGYLTLEVDGIGGVRLVPKSETTS